MDKSFYLITLFVVIWLIGKIFSWIEKSLENHRNKIRNMVLIDFQKEIDIQKTILNYKEKIASIKHEDEYCKDQITSLIGDLRNFLGKCNSCNVGHLVKRKGKYGDFIGCSNYPNCHHTEKMENVKRAYKLAIKNQILEDLHKAYR